MKFQKNMDSIQISFTKFVMNQMEKKLLGKKILNLMQKE